MTSQTFYQSQHHAWHYSTVPDSQIAALPLHATLQTMNAPGSGNLKQWSRTQFQVDMYFNRVRNRHERGFFVVHSAEFDAMPLNADDTVIYSERIAIVGSRSYPYPDTVRAYVNSLPLNAVIVSGGARGVDSVAEATAKARGMKALIFPADWARHGKQAGFLRNQDIIAVCDRLVAFWDGQSRGTAHSLWLAQQAGKPVIVYDSKGEIAA